MITLGAHSRCANILALVLLLVCAGAGAQTTPNHVIVPFNAGVGVGNRTQLEILAISNLPLPLSSLYPIRLATWSSADNAIATVNSRGVVTGRAIGTVEIRATLFRSMVLRRNVVVGLPIALISGPPVTVMNNCVKDIQVVPQDSNEAPLLDRRLSWSSLDPTIARVILPRVDMRRLQQVSISAAIVEVDEALHQRKIKIYGRAAGQATIRVSAEGRTRGIQVTVTPGDATSLVLQPDVLELDIQETGSVIAVATNAEGCTVTDSGISWTSADPTVATVDAGTGVVRGLKAGSTAITATTSSGATATLTVTVPAVSSIALNTYQLGELDIDESKTLVATPRSESGRNLANRALSWTVSNASVSLNPTAGYTTTVTGRSVGTSTITASSEGIASSSSVTVPSVASVSISPPSGSLNIGGSVSLTATPLSLQGTALNNRTITWSASNSRISVSPNTGRTTTVRGVSAGDAQATAASEGRSASASIHVRSFCESNACYSQYQFNNLSDRTLDLYHYRCEGSSCAWSFQSSVPSDMSYRSGPLTEGAAYMVRAVEVGCPVYLLNCLKLESAGFFGGPGVVAIIEAF